MDWNQGGRETCAPDSTEKPRHGLLLVTAVVVLLGSFIPALAPTASAASPAVAGPAAARLALSNAAVASPASANTAAATLAAAAVVCTSKSHPAMAAALARDIQAARHGRSSTVAVWVDDPGAGITCSLSGSSRFDSASIVKVTIVGAVLRKALDQHRYLTSTEAAQLRAMITRSDNNAASALWAKLGRSYLQHFLNLAGMRQTVLGPGGYWGLTQVTAHDEILQLRLLLTANPVLSKNSRAYALGLMAQVISSQRWGVPAGAPRSVTIHVKNGWLPRATHGWRINSIGSFTWSKGWYSVVVLSMDNPTMSYGITTVEAIARVIHRDLNPTVKTVIPLSAPNPAWGTPDELIPALPAIP
jgi:beta-lactamase class A